MKPRCRVKAPTRWLSCGVPDSAQPGDLVVGNRGAAARVELDGPVLYLHYVGNFYREDLRPRPGCKMHDNRGGT
jgi:hypothetical protein